MQIQVKRNKKNTVGDLSGLAGDYSSTYTGEDGYEYSIRGNEVKTVRVEIGVPWIAADTNLEQVGKKH